MASASIMVTGGGGLTTILNQGFESGLGSWTATNSSSGGTDPSLVIWTIRPTGYVYSTDTFTGNSGANFIMANSDLAGSGVTGDTSLFSPSFSTVGYTTLTLTYKHYLRWLTATVATVGVSTDGGGTWTTVQTYNTATVGTAAAFANASIDLGAYLGQPDVKIRFRYQSGWDWYWAVDNIVVTGNAPTQPCPAALTANSAVSRLTHGLVGDFDIDLPLTGAPGVECRSSEGNFKLVITFSNNVVSGNATVTSGTGTVSGPPTFAANTMTVNLTGVTDVQTITVTLSGVTDQYNQVLPDTPVNMTALIGDTTGNSSVNAGDVAQTKGQSGQPVTSSNFRTDVNANGMINAGDVALVKSKSGNHVP
jgi:hypothetical protein